MQQRVNLTRSAAGLRSRLAAARLALAEAAIQFERETQAADRPAVHGAWLSQAS